MGPYRPPAFDGRPAKSCPRAQPAVLFKCLTSRRREITGSSSQVTPVLALHDPTLRQADQPAIPEGSQLLDECVEAFLGRGALPGRKVCSPASMRVRRRTSASESWWPRGLLVVMVVLSGRTVTDTNLGIQAALPDVEDRLGRPSKLEDVSASNLSPDRLTYAKGSHQALVQSPQPLACHSERACVNPSRVNHPYRFL